MHYEKNFGEVRYEWGVTGTKYRFQGQRSTEFDLYDFNARFFDARLGRFVQPDSVVPLASQGVQAWDRYAGLNNNPVRFNDPTGHMISCGDGEVGACGGDTPESIYFEKQQYESKCQNGNDNYCGHPVKGIAFGLAGAGLAAAGAAFVGGSGITASVAAVSYPAFTTATASSAVVTSASTGSVAAVTEITNNGMGNLTRAAEYGIDSYLNLKKLTNGTGLQVHHIIEKRFAGALGYTQGQASKFASVVLTPSEHQQLTNAWRAAIGYGDKSGIVTSARVWDAAQTVYREYPALLEIVQHIITGY